MDLEPNETQRMVRDMARSFSERVLRPQASAFEAAEKIPPSVLAEMASLGLMGVNVAGELGGAGAGAVSYALAMMEVARGCASTAVTMAVSNMVAEVLSQFGTEAQRERWVPRLEQGSDAWLVVQRNLGSDSLQRWMQGEFSDDFTITRAATNKGYRVLRARKRSGMTGPIDFPVP